MKSTGGRRRRRKIRIPSDFVSVLIVYNFHGQV
jgi:hypothetical protein